MNKLRNPADNNGIPIPASDSIGASALVVSRDADILRVLQSAADSFAICLYVCGDTTSALTALNKRKFEAIIVDSDVEEGSDTILRAARFSPANRTAVTFAVAAQNHDQRSAAKYAFFILERPLSHDKVHNTLRAAYGMIVRERRRYFRYTLSVKALAETEQFREVWCHLINISEGGAAIASSALLQHDALSLRFELPCCEGEFSAYTRVCWRRLGSEIGIEFVSMARKAELQDWLAARLYEVLPERVARLFRAV